MCDMGPGCRIGPPWHRPCLAIRGLAKRTFSHRGPGMRSISSTAHEHFESGHCHPRTAKGASGVAHGPSLAIATLSAQRTIFRRSGPAEREDVDEHSRTTFGASPTHVATMERVESGHQGTFVRLVAATSDRSLHRFAGHSIHRYVGLRATCEARDPSSASKPTPQQPSAECPDSQNSSQTEHASWLHRLARKPDFGPPAIGFDDCLWNEAQAKPDSKRYDDEIIKIAEDRYEVGNKVHRAKRIGHRCEREKFRNQRRDRIATGEHKRDYVSL